MKLYVKAHSLFVGDLQEFDIKKELKQRYKYDTRRQDTFIHLAIYGALTLKEKCEINIDDELYITSGVGNISIIQKAYSLIYKNNEYLKPFDFINMLGNTTSYYVAKALGIKSKNIFEISNHFTIINTLISLYASLNISKKEAIFGSIDLVTDPNSLTKKVLGISKEMKILSASNYQKLSLSPENSLASIEFDIKIYSLLEIENIIKNSSAKVVTSMRCEHLKINNDEEFFETMASFYINKAIKTKEDLLYVDCYNNSYKTINVVNSTNN